VAHVTTSARQPRSLGRRFAGPKKAELPHRRPLGGNFLEGAEGKSSLSKAPVLWAPALQERLELAERHELEIVEESVWQSIIKLLHHIPRAVAHTNHDDRQGVLAGGDNGLLRRIQALF